MKFNKLVKITILLFFIVSLNYSSLFSKPLEIVYWNPFDGGDGRPMLNLVNKFNESQKQIHVSMMKFKWAPYYNKFLVNFGTNKGPDIAIAHVSYLESIDRTGTLEGLNALANSVGLDWNQFSENVRNAVKKNGRYRAVPLDTHALIMYYNKKLLKDADLLNANGQPDLKSGKKGFIEFLEKIKQKYPQKFPFLSASNNVFSFWIWYAFYSQMKGGGKYIVNGKAAFNNPQGLAAAKFMIEMRDKGLWETKSKQYIHDQASYNIFKAQMSIISFNGVWATWAFEKAKKKTGLDFGAMPIPVIFDRSATWGDSHSLIIPKNISKVKKQAAMKFAKWLTSNSGEWAKVGHIPANESVFEMKSYKELKHRSTYRRAANEINFYPSHPKLWECNDQMVAILASMMAGKLSAKEAIEKAEVKVNMILK